MAHCTYVGLALGVPSGGRKCFESLEFTDIDGPAPVDGLFPGQALHFGDLDFIANHMGRLRLSEGNAALPHILTSDYGLALASPASSILMR